MTRNSARVLWRYATTLAARLSEPVRSPLRARALARCAGATEAPSSNADPVTVLMVYRAKNRALVELLVRSLGGNADIRLWALDEVAPELAPYTLGSGPGMRFTHLNWLYRERAVREDSWVVISDDDFYFAKGSLRRTIELMARAGLSLAQPSQSLLGWWTDAFSMPRPLVVARDTNCVEQGPVVIADAAFASLMFPLPDVADMAWGIEAEWYRLKENRFRTGVIDECRVVHVGRVASSYEVAPQMRAMRERLSKSGIDSIWQLRTVNGYWWRWQRSPSWMGVQRVGA